MSLKLYKLDPSPPARAAMMMVKALGLPAEMIDVNLLDGSHKKPEYMEKNPTHTVPMLEDGDLTVHDSHAILNYLADKYAKNDTWYSKDLKQRTLVNQKLFFDTGILFPRLRNVTLPLLFKGEKQISQDKIDEIKEAYSFLEAFLSKTKFVAADHITIADLSCSATVSSLHYITPIEQDKYPKICQWLKELEKQEYYKNYNVPGVKQFGVMVQNIINKA